MGKEILKRKTQIARPDAKIQLVSFRNIILIAIGLSGMAALIYEVVWTRMLTLIFGSTVYAVATMLCAFMAGLALGSYLMARKVDKIKDLAMYFGLLELGIGIYGILFLLSLGYLQYPYFLLYQLLHNYFWLFIFAQFLFYFLVLLLPTTMFGATFPLASKIFAKDIEKVGKDVGYIYSANSLGSVLGPFLAGFILIPLIGVSKTAIFAVAINIFLGLIILGYSNLKRDLKFFIPILLLFLLIGWKIWIPPVLLNLYFAGTYKNWAQAKDELASLRPLFYKEGSYSTIAIVQTENGYIGLKSDGRGEASNFPDDMRNQVLLGYIPMILHPNPEKVLNIGVGAGVTLGAMGEFNTKEIHGIEVEPAVIEGAKQYFSKFNNNILDDPRVIIFKTDGRNQLLMNKEKYDLIISGISHPINPGTSHLITKEFFELVKSRLKEAGIFLHLIPGHRLSIEEQKIVAKTFNSVFPHTTLWMDNIRAWENVDQSVETYLIGSLEQIDLDPEEIEKRIEKYPKVRHELEKMEIYSSQDFLSLMVFNEEQFSDFVALEKRINRDDKPIFEFMVPKSLLKMKFVTLKDIIEVK